MNRHDPYPSFDEMERLMRKARRERAEAMLARLRRLAEGIRSLWRSGRRLGGAAQPRSC